MDKEVIQFVGVSDLAPEEQDIVNKLSTEYFGKIKRSVKNITSLLVHVKLYDTDGTRKKYSVHAKAISPAGTFTSEHAADWDLARAVHMSFKNLENEIKHKLHSDDQHPKAR